MAGNPPIKKFRLRRVELAVWAKKNEDGYTNYSVSVQKSFRDKDSGEYISSHSFFPEELAIVSVLAQQAVAWIAEERSHGSSRSVETGEVLTEENDPFARAAATTLLPRTMWLTSTASRICKPQKKLTPKKKPIARPRASASGVSLTLSRFATHGRICSPRRCSALAHQKAKPKPTTTKWNQAKL